MYIVRDVFQTKPGMAKELVAKFKKSSKYMEEAGFGNVRIMTDVVASYWTVVLEYGTDNIADVESARGFTSRPEVKDIMKNYMDLVIGGHREIFKVE